MLPLRRYFVFSCGVATTALGLAIVVAVLAVAVTRVSHVSEASSLGNATSALAAPVEDALAPAGASTDPLILSFLTTQVQGTQEFTASGSISGVNITFYDCAHQGFCGKMANGRRVYQGAAACSYNLALGTRFYISGDPTGRIYTCEDRGLLTNTWVDIFWYYPSDGYSWQSQVGRHGTIQIVSTP